MHLTADPVSGDILKGNMRLAGRFGYGSAGEMEGKPMSCLFQPDSWDQAQTTFQAVKESGGQRHIELLATDKKGETFPILLNLVAIHDKDGGILQIHCTLVETGQLQETRDALQESQQRFRQFMENSPLLAWIKDNKLAYRYMNEAFQRHRGVKQKEAEGKAYRDIFPGESAVRTEEVDRQVRDTVKKVESIEEHPDATGKPRKWLVYRFPLLRPDGSIWVAGTALDITDKLELESKGKFTDYALDNAAVAFFLTNQDAKILRVNKAAEKLTGYSKEELGKMTVHDLNPDLPPAQWKLAWDTLEDESYKCYTSYNRHKNGSLTPVEIERNHIVFEGEGYNMAFVRDISERVKMQELEGEASLANFGLENAATAFFLIGNDSGFLRVNEAATKLSGYTREELLELGVPDIDPNFPMPVWEQYWAKLTQEKAVRVESEFKGKDGNIIPIEVETNYLDFEGKECCLAFVRDITDRRQAQALAQQNQIMGFALQNASVAFYLTTSEAKFIRVNDASSQRTGYSQEELLAMTVHDLDPNFPAEAWPSVWEELKEKRVMHITSTHRRKDGTEFPVAVEANYIEFEGRGYNVAFAVDITDQVTLEKEQKQLQAQLEQRAEELKSEREAAVRLANENSLVTFALEQTSAAFFLISPEARILRANEAACWQTGFSREELTGKTVQEINPGSTIETWREFWKELAGKKSMRFEVTHRHADGHLFPAEIEANYLEFEGQGYNVCFIRDISQRKELEDAKERQQAELESRVEERTRELKEERQAALLLAEENRITSFAVEHASVAFFMVAEDARMLRVNSEACAQTGYTEEELTSLLVHDLDPDYPSELWPEHWAELKSKGSLRFETTHKHKDGSIVPKEVEANYFEYKGKGYNLAFVRDITERRQLLENKDKLQAALVEQVKELEHQQQEALRNAEDAQSAGERAIVAEQELSEVASELALPQGLGEFIAAHFHLNKLTLNDVMVCGRMIRALCKQHGHLEGFIHRLTNFFHNQFLDDYGNPAFSLILFHMTKPFNTLDKTLQAAAREHNPDVGETASCQVQEAIVCGLPEWKALAEKLPAAIPLDSNAIVNLNPTLANLLHQLGHRLPNVDHTGSLLHHDNIAALHHPDASSPYWPGTILESFSQLGLGSIVGFGQELASKSQFLVTAFTRGSLSSEPAQLFVHLSHSIRLGLLHYAKHERSTFVQIQAVDSLLRGHEAFATEQEERLLDTMSALQIANEDLQRSNEELDKFAFAASHDLKSPLFAIQNLVDMIDEDIGEQLPEDISELFDRLKKRLQHMDDLLDSLLAYSRIGYVEDSPTEQSVKELLESVLGLLNVPEGMKVDIPYDLPSLFAPKGALLRVFANLISNAIKHGAKPNLRIKVSCEDRLDKYAFTIEDDGIGIPSQHHERIFQMFKTLEPRQKTGSSGMGLNLVKKTVEYYGGKITLDSAPGEGTRFIFTWPKGPSRRN